MTDTQCIQFHLNEDYSVEIRRHQGSYGEYYNVNGTNYDINFPIEWVFQPPITEDEVSFCFGPEECNLCAEYGFYNGVFIGYCLHCAKHANFKRGNGMIGYGVEITPEEASVLSIPLEYDEKNSMWNVYMQTVTLAEIGDVELAKIHTDCFTEKELKPKFNFYKWLNICNPTQMYISEEENEDIPDLHSVESESKPYHLSLILPEPEEESECISSIRSHV